jgi:glycerol uptake facilitator-like aquaporin
VIGSFFGGLIAWLLNDYGPGVFGIKTANIG